MWSQQVRQIEGNGECVMVNPFDPKTVLLAKHAQHVVLVHFPIAFFLTAVGFDFAAHWTKKTSLAECRALQPG